MGKPKPAADQPGDRPEDKGAGRTNLKYVGIPVPLWERLKRYAEQDERSTNWAARKAIKDFLDRQEGKA